MNMFASIKHISLLLLAFQHTCAEEGSTSNYKIPQRPISFSTPSQQPLSNPSEKLAGDHRTLSISIHNIAETVSITYISSDIVCGPLSPSIPYIIVDLSQRLLAEHATGIEFPSSSGPVPTFVSANITEQIYRNKYILSLKLRLEPKGKGLQKTGDKWWREIVGVVREGALAVDREERGFGSAVVTEAQVEEVKVRAEWRAWEVVDGEAVVCGS